MICVRCGKDHSDSAVIDAPWVKGIEVLNLSVANPALWAIIHVRCAVPSDVFEYADLDCQYCQQCKRDATLHKVKFEDDTSIGSMMICDNCDQ